MLRQSKKDKKRRLTKPRVYGLVVLSMIVLMTVAVKIVSAPSNGTIINSPSLPTKKLQPVASTTPSTPSLTNNYFTISLPAGYQAQSASGTPAGLLFNQSLIKPSTFGSLVINMAVKTLPAGGLSGDSSYQLREMQTSRYKLSSQIVSGETVKIANDEQSAAVVAFWPHGNYEATISIASGIDNPSSDDNADELKALQPLLDAWHWN